MVSFVTLRAAQNFTLSRTACGPTCTLGTLEGPAHFKVFTLEPGIDANRPAIPPGSYPLTMAYSPRFGRAVPHVLNVPHRSHILIHPGNRPDDTDGCILLGLQQTDQTVLESRDAVHGFVVALMNALSSGDVFLEVHDGPVVP